MSNTKKLMMAAAAGDTLPINSEDVYGSTAFQYDGDNSNVGIPLGVSLAATPEFGYRIIGRNSSRSLNKIVSGGGTTDSSGNIYTIANLGDNDRDDLMVIEKWTPHFRELVWRKGIDSNVNTDTLTGRIHIGAADNLYIIANGPVNSSVSGYSVIKIDTSDGSVDWAKGYPESGNDALYNLTEDSSGNYVYIAGMAYDGTGQQSIIHKLAVSNGSQQWRKSFYKQVDDSDFATDVDILGSSIYVVGKMKFGSVYYSYIAKFSISDGSLTTFKRFSGYSSSNASAAYGITNDGTNLYVCGGTTGYGYYIAKFDSDLGLTSIRHYYDSPSTTSIDAHDIHYGSDGKLSVLYEGDVLIGSDNHRGHGIARHNTSDLTQISGAVKSWHMDGNGSFGADFIEGTGDKQLVTFGNSPTGRYVQNLVQYDITRWDEMGSNFAMQGLFDGTFDTTITSNYINTETSITVNNGRVSWTNSNYVAAVAQPFEVIDTKYFPETTYADVKGLVISKRYGATNSDDYAWLTNVLSSSSLASLCSHTTAGATTLTTSSFTGDGCSLRRGGDLVNGGEQWVAGFKKQEKFFDVVTWTGNGTAGREISHSIGSVPGCIMVKRTDTFSNWRVWHRTQTGKVTRLNVSEAFDAENGSYFGNNNTPETIDPTATVFTVGSHGDVNGSGGTYVAFIFAHNNNDGIFGPNGNLDIIKCGNYTGNGSSNNEIDLGFEPQFVIVKRASSGGNWVHVDTSRNFTAITSSSTTNYMYSNRLTFNNDNDEERSTLSITPHSNGFAVHGTTGDWNSNGADYIYIAIRKRTGLATVNNRGRLFRTEVESSYARPEEIRESADKDLIIGSVTGSASSHSLSTRTLGGDMYTNSTGSIDAGGTYNNYIRPRSNADTFGPVWSNRVISGYQGFYNMWRQQPGFLDIINWAGSGGSGTRTLNHHLGATPAMIWWRYYDANSNWYVYHKNFTSGSQSSAHNNVMYLNVTNAVAASTSFWTQAPDENSLYLKASTSTINGSGREFCAWIFAELEGVSSIGSYTGNGSSTGPTVDCNFENSPSYLLIKNMTSTGNWVMLNSVRGMGSDSNDKYMSLNTTSTEASANYVEPTSTGFQIKNTSSDINTNGATYIYYAIA